MILLNKAKCRKCGDEIESVHRHDYVRCKCGAIGVDGGHEYLRRAGSITDIQDMSIDSDDFMLIREYLKWGKNYDEKMNRLDKTEWIPIKDITNDHLEAILIFPGVSEKMKLIFLKEKQYRNLDNEDN